MHEPTFIEELYKTNQIITTTIDTLTRREMTKIATRDKIEAGDIPIQIFKSSRYAPAEILRLADEYIETIETKDKREFSVKEKITIRKDFFHQKKNETDKHVIEGVALAVVLAPVSKIFSLFSDLKRFSEYAPDYFLKSIELDSAILKSKKISAPENIKFQYSKVQISGVEFSHTLRYEISSEKKPFKKTIAGGEEAIDLQCITVAWEVDPLFKDDPLWGQKGVLVNSGRFVIEPYVEQDGFVNPESSVILYHIYIKIDPQNFLINKILPLFRGSEARDVLTKLAGAMREEAKK